MKLKIHTMVNIAETDVLVMRWEYLSDQLTATQRSMLTIIRLWAVTLWLSMFIMPSQWHTRSRDTEEVIWSIIPEGSTTSTPKMRSLMAMETMNALVDVLSWLLRTITTINKRLVTMAMHDNNTRKISAAVIVPGSHVFTTISTSRSETPKPIVTVVHSEVHVLLQARSITRPWVPIVSLCALASSKPPSLLVCWAVILKLYMLPSPPLRLIAYPLSLWGNIDFCHSLTQV